MVSIYKKNYNKFFLTPSELRNLRFFTQLDQNYFLFKEFKFLNKDQFVYLISIKLQFIKTNKKMKISIKTIKNQQFSIDVDETDTVNLEKIIRHLKY